MGDHSQKWDGKGNVWDFVDSVRDEPPRPIPEASPGDDWIVRELLEGQRVDRADVSAVADPAKTDSPLEAAMFAALTATGFSQSDERGRGGIARLYQNVPVVTHRATYRVDLAAIRRVGKFVLRLAIECDGFEFHHATKEQLEWDARRDRALLRAGWRVARYPGSEIHRDASLCALDAAGIVIEWVDAVSRVR